MKNPTAQSKLYFSAYPLKAVTGSSPDPAAENSALHISNKTKAIGRIRVHPMTNPYKKVVKPTPRIKPSNSHEDINENKHGWYGNYE